MTIIHKLEDFLFNLFPRAKEAGNNIDILKEELTNYYKYGPYIPVVSIADDFVTVEIDTTKILKEDSEYRKAVSLCENRKYPEAKTILSKLITQNPTNSEYYRIYGQIMSDEGDQEEAVNYLIDALRWDSKNVYALLMMGNIFAKFKNDMDTARKYYDQVLVVNPTDNIALNNIGANLLQLGKTDEGVEYLKKAFAINPDYPNTSYGLAVAFDKLGSPLVAFDYSIHCAKISSTQTQLRKMALATAMQVAEQYVKDKKDLSSFKEYKSFLERKYGKEIQVEEDATIPTAAKMEFAENYDRDYHLIKYKPGYKAVEHLMMHELVHLQFACEAQADNANMLFISGAEKKTQFMRDNEKELHKLKKEGLSESAIANYMSMLYEGINRQVFNTPIDLFIEDYLYEVYKEARPQQFVSLLQLFEESLAAINNKNSQKLVPKYIYTASKVLNMVNARQLKDLYGIDLVNQYNPLPSELREANRMWDEFTEYRENREPGEEYEIIQHWGKDLKLDNYFELVNEEDFRARPQSIDELLNSATEDPYGVEIDKNYKEQQTRTFLESQEAIGTNQAVLWFMVDALQFFKGWSKEKIKAIAFEIALIGTQGINPEPGRNYEVKSIPGKVFSGYHLLAYYYVSWKLAIPDMLDQLRLPFDEEYKMAETILNSKE